MFKKLLKTNEKIQFFAKFAECQNACGNAYRHMGDIRFLHTREFFIKFAKTTCKGLIITGASGLPRRKDARVNIG